MTPQDAIAELLASMTRLEAANVEKACEAALQGGACGVSTWRWQTDDGSIDFEARVDAAVPYGVIHQYEWGIRPPPL